MNFQFLKEEIYKISPSTNKGKPHKILALLAVIEGINNKTYNSNYFYYDNKFKQLFTLFYEKYINSF